MKNIIKTLVAIAAFGAFSLAAHAQPGVKLLVVDMSKLYENHYKTIEQNAKIQSDDAKATEEVEKMNKEGNALVEEYKALAEQANNPALTPEAKSKAQGEAQKKLESINKKQQEIQTFIGNTRQILGQRFQTFKNVMLEELSKVAADVAKRKGATLLIDKSGPSAFGISNIVYTDPAYDITDDVMKEINKDRPANAPTAPAAGAPSTPAPAPAAAAPASSPSSAPAVTVPGLTPTKK
jgi:outer membrane protein